MSNFLDDLKKSVEEGEFNSEAAKKINEVDAKADEVLEEKSTEQIEQSVIDTAISGGVKTIDGADFARLQSEYEEKMKERAKEEILLATVVTLINEDEELEEKLYSLGTFVNKLREEHPLSENEGVAALHAKMDEVEEKYDLQKYIAG